MIQDTLKVALFLIGVALVLAGVAMVYVPAMLIIAGIGSVKLFKEIA